MGATSLDWVKQRAGRKWSGLGMELAGSLLSALGVGNTGLTHFSHDLGISVYAHGLSAGIRTKNIVKETGIRQVWCTPEIAATELV